MSARRAFYRKFVDRKSRLRKLLYLLIFLVLFAAVLFDSFSGDLPFHFVLFFAAGRLLSLLLSRGQIARWDERNRRFVVERNIAGWLVIVAVILARFFVVPEILTQFQVVPTSDAVFLILMGWYFGRIRQLSAQIEEHVFTSYAGNQPLPG